MHKLSRAICFIICVMGASCAFSQDIETGMFHAQRFDFSGKELNLMFPENSIVIYDGVKVFDSFDESVVFSGRAQDFYKNLLAAAPEQAVSNTSVSTWFSIQETCPTCMTAIFERFGPSNDMGVPVTGDPPRPTSPQPGPSPTPIVIVYCGKDRLPPHCSIFPDDSECFCRNTKGEKWWSGFE